MRSRSIQSLPTHHHHHHQTQPDRNAKKKDNIKPTSHQGFAVHNMMFAIDNFLLTHTPPWYRTPKVQTVMLGIIFFWVFAAYTTIQFYSASTYGSSLAADSVSAVYLSFTLTCLISPAIINKYGCRLSMFFGVLGYASLVLASLIYFLYGSSGSGGEGDDDALWARRLVVLGGAVLGCGAATLWTAQGRLILQYASRAEELDNGGSSSTTTPTSQESGSNKPKKTQTGKLMGLFWAIFQCSSLVGGSISFIYFNRKPEGSTALYTLFLGFIIMGALFTQFLLPPSMLRSSVHKTKIDTQEEVQRDVEMTSSEQTPLTAADTTAQFSRGESQLNEHGIKVCEDLSNQSWWQEAKGTLKMFLTKNMMYLSLLFFYTGFNQPYQQATFGNRFFTRRTIGAELIIFHLMEIVGAIICGRYLDKEEDDTSFNVNRRKRAIICLGAFVVINGIGNVFAAMQEYGAKENKGATAHDIAEWGVISPSLAFACWGFADAQIQVYCYWLMGSINSTGSDHARAVGFYKCVQSLGTSLGFYLIPTSRLSEISQLACSSFVFVVGTALSVTQLPP